MSTLEDRANSEGAVIAAYGSPFSHDLDWRPFPRGLTVWEIVNSLPLPEGFDERGIVRINDHEINRSAWHLVRPKPTSRELPIVVTFHMAPRGGRRGGGGGSGAGKAVIGLVALLALTVVTAGIAGGALAFLGGPFASGGLFAAGTIGAKILAGAVGLVGALAISALTRPPAAKQETRSNTEDSLNPASADGNQIQPNGAIPRVIGTRKVFPQLAGEPVVELVGEDEFVEAVYILSGPHDLTDIRLSNSPITSADDIEYETKEGWQTDTAITLVTRQGRTLANQIEIKGHVVAPSAQTQVWDELDPASDSPIWHSTASRREPDQVWLQFMLPEGLRKTDFPNNQVTIPIRIRMRIKGSSTWINLPELHYSSNRVSQQRLAIDLKWYADPVVANYAYTSNAFIAAHHIVPDQAVEPFATGWTAHSYFNAGSSKPLYTASINDSSAGCQHVYLNGGNVVIVHLDPATFPKGLYEFEIKRGAAFYTASLARDTYVYSGGISAVHDFFGWHTAGGTIGYINLTKDQLADRLYLTRTVSIWNEHPLPVAGFATIAVKAKNRSVEQLSVVASGYVQDWNGAAWDNWTITSNPAPHFVDILRGRLNLDPLPTALFNNTSLTDWRLACIYNDYTCDMIVDDYRIEDLLNVVASCGYAAPYWSETWGVVMDYDRSAESPVQVFTPRNSRGFKFRKALARLPDGLRISYRLATDDYEPTQVNVYRDGGAAHDDARIEQVTYDGLCTEAKITARATFDLNQAMYRSTFYELYAPVEWLVCRKGSLVAVQHDVLEHHTASGYITAVNLSGSNIVSIELNTEVDILDEIPMESVPDLSGEDDMTTIGISMGCVIRRTDGTTSTHTLSNAAGRTRTLTFVTPIFNDMTTGSPFDGGSIPEITTECLVVIGPLGSEYRRMIVKEITPAQDLEARIVMVDEAPELWS